MEWGGSKTQLNIVSTFIHYAAHTHTDLLFAVQPCSLDIITRDIPFVPASNKSTGSPTFRHNHFLSPFVVPGSPPVLPGVVKHSNLLALNEGKVPPFQPRVVVHGNNVKVIGLGGGVSTSDLHTTEREGREKYSPLCYVFSECLQGRQTT